MTYSMTGHPGQWKTLELVSHNYWWPGISCYITSYVAGCGTCNCCKSFPTQKVGKLTPSTEYHRQTDGQTDQVNQEIEAYLWVFVSHCQDDWVDWLPLAEFAYNNCVHSTTCHTPFELDSGQHPQMGLEPTWSSAVEAADDFAQQMSQMQEEVKAALGHAADKMAQYYNCQRSPTPVYEVGAKVWLNTQNYMTTHLTKKLDHNWLGPFVIEKVVSSAAVKLCLSPCK